MKEQQQSKAALKKRAFEIGFTEAGFEWLFETEACRNLTIVGQRLSPGWARYCNRKAGEDAPPAYKEEDVGIFDNLPSRKKQNTLPDTIKGCLDREKDLRQERNRLDLQIRLMQLRLDRLDDEIDAVRSRAHELDEALEWGSAP